MGGGGGADVSFRPIQSMRCPQIQPVGGECCPLSANSASGRCACIRNYYSSSYIGIDPGREYHKKNATRV